MAETRTVMPEGAVAEGRQYVTFGLNDETYAVDALSVQEIIELGAVTKVPHLPEFFRGVINLRGAIIPIIDLKRKFRMSPGERRKHTCVVVTEIEGRVMGLIVDTVSDVLQLPEDALTAAPDFGVQVATDFMRGMARVDNLLVIVLDTHRILSEAEAAAVPELQDAPEPAPPAPTADE